MGRAGEGRTACCLYCAEELEHTLALALSGVRAKVTADSTEGVCLELIPGDLGRGCHLELEVCGTGGLVNGEEQTKAWENKRLNNYRSGVGIKSREL
jgi:hypothetical protein